MDLYRHGSVPRVATRSTPARPDPAAPERLPWVPRCAGPAVVLVAAALLGWLTLDVLSGGPWTRVDHAVSGRVSR